MINVNIQYRVIAAVLLIPAFLCLWVYRNFSRDLEAAGARTAPSELADTRCGRIEYASIGNGPPILMVHGAGGGFDQGLDTGIDLAQRGFRVIAMSRFGYLRTPLPQAASAEAQADAHACLLDALGIERAAIIGASAGAPSALQFALRYPDRCSGAALIVPALYRPHSEGEASLTTPGGTPFLFDTALKSDFLFWLGPAIAQDMFIKSILATPPEVVRTASSDERERVNRTIDHILPISARRLGLLNDAKITRALERYPLENVRAPTLIVSVADDLFGTYDVARYTADHIPNARFVGYESGGHLFVGHRAELTEEIANFLMGPLTKEAE